MTEPLRLFPDRGLAAAKQEAHDMIERATKEHRPEAVFLLLSGGNDSMVLLDSMTEHADAIVHIETGIGIPETTTFALDRARESGLPVKHLHPPIAYEDLVLSHPVLKGMPGPGVHSIMYQRLKERCIRVLLANQRDRIARRRPRFLLVSGVRKAESKRRMGYARPINRTGGQVWVNPLFTWTGEEMAEYRRTTTLPQSEVAANLHMSGECICGAMADQGPAREERAALRFFYPSADDRLSTLEEECRRAGKRYCEWGVKRPPDDMAKAERSGQLMFTPMCVGCEGRTEV